MKYETVEEIRGKRSKAKMPVIGEFQEFKAFGDKLNKLPQKKAEAFILIQNIIDLKEESEVKG